MRARARLRRIALSLPDAREDHPWGEDVAKVGTKIFAYLGRPGSSEISLGVKLDRSRLFALSQPFVSEMRYGLGRSGWVVATFSRGDVPLSLLRDWILESYELVAPRAARAARGSLRSR